MRYVHEREALEMFDNMLDECYENISVCGLEYLPSATLERVDPIAYRVGYHEWLDSEGITTDEDAEDDDN